jgi:hypothetical protein
VLAPETGDILPSGLTKLKYFFQLMTYYYMYLFPVLQVLKVTIAGHCFW